MLLDFYACVDERLMWKQHNDKVLDKYKKKLVNSLDVDVDCSVHLSVLYSIRGQINPTGGE